MKNNETKTPENKNAIAITRKATSYVNKYNQAMQGIEKSAWNLCKVVYDTVNAPDFKEVFGTMTEYSKALNVSKSSLSKYYKAYERRTLLLENNPDNNAYSVTQIAEMGAIEIEETMAFVEVEKVTTEDTAIEIREKAKHYLNKDTETEEETTEEETTEETTEEETEEVIYMAYKGKQYTITNPDYIATIKELLEM